jgi:hypothetical protein
MWVGLKWIGIGALVIIGAIAIYYLLPTEKEKEEEVEILEDVTKDIVEATII